ncbi:8-amino-7-oxononanoate synthase [Gammaproteobacteria bacterium]|nr:8-amino-7-oxononanoate synthase [Gammaproteobacteria bacterium]
MPRTRSIAERLADLRRRDLYRRRRVVEGPQGREIRVDGRALLNFCSNDYLGLAADPRVRESLREAALRWGVGAGASHLVCGHTAAHQELEEALAAFTGRPRALLFGSGYAANMGAIGALLGPRDRVFEDRLNHASLLDGGWLSGARFSWYRHADVVDLAQQLQAAAADRPAGQALVVSDGAFSMDGDLCPLAELVDVAHRHGAWLMIDEAHGLGVHGRGGRGLVDAQRFGTGDVPVLVGTLGKAFGTAGAFVAGGEDFIELLVQRARPYIYTTAQPAALAAATLTSLRIAEAEEWRRERLRELVARFHAGLAALGLPVPASTLPIQPVVVGDPARAVALSSALEDAGLLISAIRPPTVPAGTSRLRVTFTAAHGPGDVDRLVEALAGALRAVPGEVGDA